jgi:hypothetical protein
LLNILTLDIEFQDKENIIQTDYTLGAAATLDQLTFIYDVINFTGEDRDQATTPTFGATWTNLLNGRNKISRCYIKIPAGSTEFTHKFTGFTAPFSTSISFSKRTLISITPYARKPFELTAADLNLISDYTLKGWRT